MPTPDQRAEVRPISFIFHNTATGGAPKEHKLVVRPEELTRSDVSRLTVHQTLGGAWGDSFGGGLPTIQLAGTTGWGMGGLPNGQIVFQNLYDHVYNRWHIEREQLAKNGKNPDLVKLIFHDVLDDFTWLVAPNQFILKRSKSRPLLSQYNINLTYISDNVSETMTALLANQRSIQEAALSSFDQTLKDIVDFANEMAGEINDFLGPIKDGVAALVGITSAVLHAVRTVIGAGMTIVDSVTGNLIDMAAGLSMAASNVFATVTAVQSVPGRIMARLIRAKTLFQNAACVLSNTFKSRSTLPNYDDVYGSSTCSSTSGGRPLSKYLDVNTMEAITPIIKNQIAVDSDAAGALMHLNKMDVALHPESLATIGSLSKTVADGITI